MADRYQTGAGAGAVRVRDMREPVTEVGERSTVELIKDAVGNIQGMIRAAIELANAEMKEKVSKASKAGIVLAAGAVLLLYAVGFLLAAIYHALSNAVAPWLSALIVFGILAIAGLVMLSVGRKRMKQFKPAPEKTMERVKEDVQWLRNRTR